MFEAFKQRLHNWRLYRQGSSQLQALDDHLLADMGIDRQEIRRRARAAALAPERSR